MATTHYRETSGLEVFLGVRRHAENFLGHWLVSAYDHGLDSFGVQCATCGDTWMITNHDFGVWIAEVPFEYAQMIRLFLRSPALDTLLNDTRPYIHTLPSPPVHVEPPPKSVYQHLLEDEDEP